MQNTRHLHTTDIARCMRIDDMRLALVREVRDNMTIAEYQAMIKRATMRIKNDLNIKR